jgi:uncharacterized protein (UPF0332 family)
LLAKARNSLEMAQLCFEAGGYDSALSRAYYSMYQAALAALIYFDIPISEEGITFGERWEHTTVPIALMEYLGYPEELVQKLQFAYRWRVEADYLPLVTPSNGARLVIEYAEEMIHRVEEDIER